MRIALLLLTAAGIGGCANGGAAALASQEGSYRCFRIGHSGPATVVSRTVAVHATPDAKRLALAFGRGSDEQVLDPVIGGAGGAGRLYANQRYAWRIDTGSGVLTDVESITTYSCVRAAASAPGGPQRTTVSDAGRGVTPAGAASFAAGAGSRPVRGAAAS